LRTALHLNGNLRSAMLIGMATAASTALREKVDRHLSEIKDAVLKHGGVSISLFGSVARGEDNSASDIASVIPGFAVGHVGEGVGFAGEPKGTFP